MKLWIRLAGMTVSVVIGIFFVLLVAGQVGALRGQRPADLGVHGGRLRPPSATRNSVSSQAGFYAGDGAQYARIDPLRFDGTPAQAMQRLADIVGSIPGARIVESRPDYLYAEFTTRWLHFVDDAEFFLPESGRQIDLRSGSRLGRGDLGVNRRRIEAIRARFEPRTAAPR